MFIDNKYTKYYYNIINTALARSISPDTYTEKHHIIPESFYIARTRKGIPGWVEGNPNDSTNLVKLTAKEHFICHLLLTKMTTGDAQKKMIFAFNAIAMLRRTYHYRYTSNQYSIFKTQYSKLMRSRMLGENNPMFNKTPSDATKHKMSESHKNIKPWNIGIQLSVSHKLAISDSVSGIKNPMYGKCHSSATKLKQSLLKLGKPNVKLQGKAKSKEHKQKLSDANKGKPLSEEHKQKLKQIPKCICIHCGKHISPQMFSRWHGDNCSTLKI